MEPTLIMKAIIDVYKRQTLDALVKAEQKYKESGDLSGFDNTSFDALINNSIKEAIAKDGEMCIRDRIICVRMVISVKLNNLNLKMN